jgi:hypothetical protein
LRRLRDRNEDDSGDPRVETAAELLAHVPALGRDMIRQRLVRSRLRAASARPRLGVWRPALVLVLLLASAAAAHGVSKRRWLGLVEAQKTLSTAKARAAERPPQPKAAPVAARVVELSPPALAVVSVSPVPSRIPHAALKPASVPPPVPAATAEAAREPVADAGTELMVEAMQARRGGDLARAERLLNEYRRRFPAGALAEEALALSVETAALRGSAITPELARAYLARFPAGRYRKWVEGTLKPAVH